MNQDDFKRRTKVFGLAVISLTERLPSSRTAEIVARQLLRSATSVGANYRASCRARSPAEMLAKLSIVEEEADESLYWLEILAEAHLVSASAVEDLVREAGELLAMTVASKKTLKLRVESAKRLPANRQSTIGNRQS